MNDKNKLNRKFHAMVNFAFENLPDKYAGNYPAMVCLKEELIKRAGFYRDYTNMKGDNVYFAESVSGMKLERLQRLYDAVWQVISERIDPLCNNDFTSELLKFKRT